MNPRSINAGELGIKPVSQTGTCRVQAMSARSPSAPRRHHVQLALSGALMILLGEVTFGGASRVYGQELEKVPAGEPQAIETIVSRALAELRRYYAPGAPLVRRDAHSKAHGCVKATFQVEPDLPTDLRVGFLSVPGKEYWAWLRFSNGAFKPGSDTGMDGRGMALKLMEPEFSGDAVSAPPRSHDILMINYPVFFSPDAIDYAEFAKAGALTEIPMA
jgi:hypothetical protein